MLDAFKKVEASLKNKLYSILRLFKFFFLPQNKVLGVLLVINVVFFVFLIGHFSQAADDSLFSMDAVTKLINRLLFLVAYALGWLVTKIFTLVVLISSYNGFVDSAAVTKGWVLVRDVCNMLFVIVLLVIAFSEILHLKNYRLKSMLPQVILAAVLVNFSKLICALIIDAAQVAMMTFVNGYQATAGANIVVGLGLTKLLKFNEDAGAGSKPGIEPYEITVGIVLAIVMLLATLLVVFFIALILVVRIVVLWLLIVLSPVAFISGAVPISAIQSKSKEWWNKFGSYVAIGPMMAFFLWLSLSVMSNPDQMYAKDADTAIIERTSKSAPTEMGLVDNIIQFGIGLALLMASLMAAQEAGGFAGQLASTGLSAAKSAAKGAGKWMASPVTDRASALYGGFAEGQKKKRAAKQADLARTWGNVGRKGFRVKEGIMQGGKQALGAPVKYGAAGVAALGGGALGAAGGYVVGGKAGAKAGWSQGAGKGWDNGKKAAERFVVGNGDFERQSRQASFGETQKANSAASLAILKGRNLDNGKPESQAELKRIALNGAASSAERKAALDILAKQGKIDSRELVVAGQNLFKENEKAGDFDAGKGFLDAVKKTRADLAYDKTDLDQISQDIIAGKDTDATKAFVGSVKKGDIALGSLDSSALENEAFLTAMMHASNKIKKGKFDKDASTVAEGDDSEKAMKLKKTVTAMGQSILTSSAAGSKDWGAGRSDAVKDLQKTVAKVTGDLKLAYGERDATTGVSTGNMETAFGDDVKEVVAESNEDQLSSMIKDPNGLEEVSKHAEPRQLDGLASSRDPKHHKALDQIVKKVSDLQTSADAAVAAAAKKSLLESSSNSRVMSRTTGDAKAALVTVAETDFDDKIADINSKLAKAEGDLRTANTAFAAAETTLADPTATAPAKAAAQTVKTQQESERRRFEGQISRYEQSIEKFGAEKKKIKK